MKSGVLVFLMMIVLAAGSAQADYSRRNEALQLYQEGLFQETGTGDLTLAQNLYGAILENYGDYRDVASVALYRLGLISQKRGDFNAAEKYYQQILVKYVEQQTVVKQAKAKLDALGREPGEADKPSRLPSAEVSLRATAPAPANKNPRPSGANGDSSDLLSPIKLGIGVNTFGMHLSYRISDRVQIEIRNEFAPGEPNLIAGRGSYFPSRTLLPGPLAPYTGMEYARILEGAQAVGYRTGLYAGCELRLLGFLGFNADGGYYYQNQDNAAGKEITTFLRLHAGVTCYF